MARRLGLLFVAAALPLVLVLPLGSGAQSGDLQRKIDRKRAAIEQHRGRERVLTTVAVSSGSSRRRADATPFAWRERRTHGVPGAPPASIR